MTLEQSVWEGLANWKCWLGPEVRASQTRLGPLFCGWWRGTGSGNLQPRPDPLLCGQWRAKGRFLSESVLSLQTMSHPSVDDGRSLLAERSSVLGVGKGLTGTQVRISEIFFFSKKRKEKQHINSITQCATVC